MIAGDGTPRAYTDTCRRRVNVTVRRTRPMAAVRLATSRRSASTCTTIARRASSSLGRVVAALIKSANAAWMILVSDIRARRAVVAGELDEHANVDAYGDDAVVTEVWTARSLAT